MSSIPITPPLHVELDGLKVFNSSSVLVLDENDGFGLEEGTSASVWRKHLMFLVGVGVVVLSAILRVVWVACFAPPTEAAREIREERRKLISAAIAAALEWDKKKEEEGKGGKRGGRGEKAGGEEGGGEAESGGLSEEDTTVPIPEDVARERKLPAMSTLFDLLYDEAECKKTTSAFAVSAELWEKGRDLLSLSLQRDLRVGMSSTKKARWPGEYPLEEWEMITEVQAYEDGVKLQEAMDFVEKVKKNLNDLKPIEVEMFREAEELLKSIDSERSEGLRRVMAMALPSLPAYILGLVLNSTSTIISSYVSNSSTRMLDVATEVDGLERIQDMLVFSMALRALVAVVDGAADWAHTRARFGFLLPLRTKLAASMTRQDISFFDARKTDVLKAHLSSHTQQVASSVFSLPTNVINTLVRIFTAAYFVSTATTSTKLLVVALGPALVLSISHIILCRINWGSWKRIWGLQSILSRHSTELLGKLRTIREFAMEEQEVSRRTTLETYKVEEEMTSDSIDSLVWSTFSFGWSMQNAAMTLVGAGLLHGKEIEMGALLAVSSQISSIAWGFRSLMSSAPKLFKALGPAGMIAEILAKRGRIEAPRNDDDLIKEGQIDGAITFDKVHFSYPSEPRKEVLRGLSFSTDPRKGCRSIALVGETGCGKTTTIALLKRFYEATGGEILVDGKPISAYDPRFLRRNMAIVAQETVLLEKSLRENICYGLPKPPSEEEVEFACKQASIWDDIQAMPEKLDTIFDGNNLSGGQKQRIAIARALIRKPTILLLDEATASLDALNERAVQDAIDKMLSDRGFGCSITISHRLTTIRRSDAIYVIEKGKVSEHGTHDSLLGADGTYAKLWRTQIGE